MINRLRRALSVRRRHALIEFAPTPNNSRETLLLRSFDHSSSGTALHRRVRDLRRQARGLRPLRSARKPRRGSTSTTESNLKNVSMASEFDETIEKAESSDLISFNTTESGDQDGKEFGTGYFVDSEEFTSGPFVNASVEHNGEKTIAGASKETGQDKMTELLEAMCIGISQDKETNDNKTENKESSQVANCAGDVQIQLAASGEHDEMTIKEKMNFIMAALDTASSKDGVCSAGVEMRADLEAGEETVGEDTLIDDELITSSVKDLMHLEKTPTSPAELPLTSDTPVDRPEYHVDGSYEATAEEIANPDEKDKKLFNLAWIPKFRFKRANPTPTITKPTKPLFTSAMNPMSRQETNIYRTDVLAALKSHVQTPRQQEIKAIQAERCEYIKAEVVSVLAALDLVSAHQEYISLMVQMFKDEPEKLTEEFKEVIEYRLIQINEEDRAVMVRFALLEVEWEMVLALDEELRLENERQNAEQA